MHDTDRDDGPTEEVARPPRLVVLDADGTLVPEGAGSTPSRAALAALETARDAAEGRLHLALVSGRTVRDTRKVADPAGVELFSAELGAVLVVPGRAPELTIPWEHPGDPVDAVRDAGVLDAVLEAYPELSVDDRYGHRVSLPVSGRLGPADVAEIKAIVEDHDPRFTARDNTVGGRIVVVHLAPRGVGKATGVRALQAHLGVGPKETVLIGDSPEDAACHGCVRRVYLVANGTPGTVPDRHVVRTRADNGAGVAEGLGREFGF